MSIVLLAGIPTLAIIISLLIDRFHHHSLMARFDRLEAAFDRLDSRLDAWLDHEPSLH